MLNSAPAYLYYDQGPSLFKLAWYEPLPGASVPEQVVQELWRAQRLRHGSLRTTGGDPVEIIDPGTYNTDGGPDFRFACLRIGDTVLFGDIEIHTTSRVWFQHGHQHDPRYNSVVLHVVLQPDLLTGTLQRADGTTLPELVLAAHLDGSFREHLVQFFSHPAASRPCSWGLPDVPPTLLDSWLRKCAEARLYRRSMPYQEASSVAQLVYENAAAALGYRPNASAMRRLAQRVSLHDLCTLRSARDRIALLLGMAGLIPDASHIAAIEEEATRRYSAELKARFEALQPRDVQPMDKVEWQYARLRPANFPELRIAQLAALVCPAGPLGIRGPERFSRLLVEEGYLDAFDRLLDVTPDDYWTRHYRLTHPAAFHTARIGRVTRQRVLVNVVLPAVLAQAPAMRHADWMARALDLLAQLPPENDALVRDFSLPDSYRITLLHTQGLHELNTSMCVPQRCLQCTVGAHLLGIAGPVLPRQHDLPPLCLSASSTSTSPPST